MNKYVVIHHSATSQNISDNVINSFSYYNDVIKSSGEVVHKKDTLNYRTAEAKSYDICLIGDFREVMPTVLQLNALQTILVRLAGYSFLGHGEIKDFNIYDSRYSIWPTECPGTKLLNWIKEKRNETMSKIILVKNNTGGSVQQLLDDVNMWYHERGELILFSGLEKSPWAILDIQNGANDSGGCKNTKPYYINLMLSDAQNMERTDLIHEIQHCYYFDAGLGDLHDIRTPEFPMGMSMDNVYNWNYFVNNKDMKLTREQINKLYQLIFKRDMDVAAEPYVGQSLDFVLGELVKSKEHLYYTALFVAARKIEKEL